MDRGWTWMIVLAMVLFLAGMAECGEGFQPSWQIGQTWTIEASFRRLADGSNAWTAPQRWRYEVKNRKEIDGVDCFVLHITPVDRPESKTQAILCLAVSDLRPVQVIDVAPGADGRATATTRRFDGERLTPLLSGESPIPYDLPLFPLAAETRTGETTAGGFTGEAAHRADGLTFVEGVHQSWQPNGDGFEVTLETSGPLGTIRQTWEPGRPWATRMVSDAVRCTLVDGQ
ncbi:MAG: hypothetical protein OZSIB_0117 [Candidatus Ozemobacter sibiricus]|uniref:Uncharacterized protein n=1 Tax=Candidatus Ozemobacter sibiricus TaxID=2268124 RepID=A0A367ZMJ7_9BACT|nr:MAG: hypothetical protein OZSIB_0117 [Candidatus Ozemobacter sibiricus]